MLTEIIKLLKERGPMSLAELARQFQSDIPAMQGMLEILERKQRIQRLDPSGAREASAQTRRGSDCKEWQTKCSRCKGCVEVKPEDALIFRAL